MISTFTKKSLHVAVFAGLAALGTTGTAQAVDVITSRKRKEEVPFITQSQEKTKERKNRTFPKVKNFATQKRGRGMR